MKAMAPPQVVRETRESDADPQAKDNRSRYALVNLDLVLVDTGRQGRIYRLTMSHSQFPVRQLYDQVKVRQSGC